MSIRIPHVRINTIDHSDLIYSDQELIRMQERIAANSMYGSYAFNSYNEYSFNSTYGEIDNDYTDRSSTCMSDHQYKMYMMIYLKQMILTREFAVKHTDNYWINRYREMVKFFIKPGNEILMGRVLKDIEDKYPNNTDLIDGFMNLWWKLKQLILNGHLKEGNNEEMKNCAFDTVLRFSQHEKLMKKRSDYYELINVGSSEDKEVPLTIGKNYVEWFLKYFVFGKAIYKKLFEFNKILTRKVQEGNYFNSDGGRVIDPKDVMFLPGNNYTKLKGIMGINNEGFDLDIATTVGSDFKPSIKDFISQIDKFPELIESEKLFILKDNNINFNTKTVSFKTEKQYNEYVYEILSFPFSFFNGGSGLRKYFNAEISEISKLTISVCNYTDSLDRRHQYITMSMTSDRNRYEIGYDSETLVFYYIPETVDFLFHVNRNIEDPHHFNYINDYSYYPDILHHNSDVYLISENNCSGKKIRIFRVDKPIFDDEQIETFRALDWIYRRSRIEQIYCDNYRNDGTDTRKKVFREFKDKYRDQFTESEMENEFYQKYPMFKYEFINHYKEKEIQNDLRSQWYQQLFMKCVNESLHRIIDDSPNNKYGYQIFKNGFISSRDSMLQHYINNNSDYKNIDIMNLNLDFIMNEILHRAKKQSQEK